jgi:hypothetical protein
MLNKNMVRCNFCKKKCSMPLMCKYCDTDFCIKCRHYETHRCTGYTTMQSAKQELLKETLEKQKTDSVKVIKI